MLLKAAPAFPVRRRTRPESGTPVRPRPGVGFPPATASAECAARLRIATHTSSAMPAPPPSSQQQSPTDVLCARLASSRFSDSPVSRTPRMRCDAGCAWQAALEHSGLFRMGAITPSTRCCAGRISVPRKSGNASAAMAARLPRWHSTHCALSRPDQVSRLARVAGECHPPVMVDDADLLNLAVVADAVEWLRTDLAGHWPSSTDRCCPGQSR